MLYTCSILSFKKLDKKFKAYYIMKNCGNDEVAPDPGDLQQYKKGELTWQGFRVNYLAKLMRPEAEEWMKRVAREAVSGDVVLVSDEEKGEDYYRVMLAEIMINMFSGQTGLRYGGELKI